MEIVKKLFLVKRDFISDNPNGIKVILRREKKRRKKNIKKNNSSILQNESINSGFSN